MSLALFASAVAQNAPGATKPPQTNVVDASTVTSGQTPSLFGDGVDQLRHPPKSTKPQPKTDSKSPNHQAQPSTNSFEFQFERAFVFESNGNFAEAFRFYQLAAQQGLPAAQTKTAEFLQKGQGTERDLNLAAYWYRRAATQDDIDAQIALAKLFAAKAQTYEQCTQAIVWAKIAAQNTNATAEHARIIADASEIVDRVTLLAKPRALQWGAQVKAFHPSEDAGPYMPPAIRTFTEQAMDLRFSEAELGVSKAGVRIYARYCYAHTNVVLNIRKGTPLPVDEEVSLALDVFANAVTGNAQHPLELSVTNLTSVMQIAQLPSVAGHLTTLQLAALAFISVRDHGRTDQKYRDELLLVVIKQFRRNPDTTLLDSSATTNTLAEHVVAFCANPSPPIKLQSEQPPPPAKPTAPAVRWLSDVESAKQEARAQRKMVLIDFTQNPDGSFEQATFTDAKFAEYAAKNLVCVHVMGVSRFDNEAPTDAQRRYGVARFPTVIILNSSGAELGRLGPSQPGPIMIEAIEGLKSDPQPARPANRRPARGSHFQ